MSLSTSRRLYAFGLTLTLSLVLAGCGGGSGSGSSTTGNTLKASCASGDNVETGLQGQTTLAERMAAPQRKASNAIST